MKCSVDVRRFPRLHREVGGVRVEDEEGHKLNIQEHFTSKSEHIDLTSRVPPSVPSQNWPRLGSLDPHVPRPSTFLHAGTYAWNRSVTANA